MREQEDERAGRAVATLDPRSTAGLPALFRPTLVSAKRTRGFFTANIRNPNTRKAYAHAMGEFAAWCGDVVTG